MKKKIFPYKKNQKKLIETLYSRIGELSVVNDFINCIF
jgi:hypothetical protein